MNYFNTSSIDFPSVTPQNGGCGCGDNPREDNKFLNKIYNIDVDDFENDDNYEQLGGNGCGNDEYYLTLKRLLPQRSLDEDYYGSMKCDNDVMYGGLSPTIIYKTGIDINSNDNELDKRFKKFEKDKNMDKTELFLRNPKVHNEIYGPQKNKKKSGCIIL